MNEFFKICMALKQHFSLFHAVMKISNIEYDPNQKFVAALYYYPDMDEFFIKVRKDLWDDLSFEQKKFVLAHECVHFIFEHLSRKEDYMNQEVFNYAADIITNHTLVNKFNFNREQCDPENRFIWCDQILNEEYSDNESMESYYEKLKKNNKNSKNDKNELINDHSNQKLSEEESKNMFKKILDHMDVGDIEKLKNVIKQNAGNTTGGIFKSLITKRLKIKKPFESIIKKWARTKMSKDIDKFDDFWVTPPKFSLLPNTITLPSQIRKDPKKKEHVKVFFFADASGSCSSYVQRFLDTAKSLPAEYFDVRMFYFDTNVKEIKNFKNKNKHGLSAFGGTQFKPMETEIKQIMSKEGIDYPDAVFVFTDGYNSDYNFKVEKPENWYWFITTGGSIHSVPENSNIFRMKDFV